MGQKEKLIKAETNKKYTSKDSNPYISRMLMDLPVRRFPTTSDLLICSTSQSNKLA